MRLQLAFEMDTGFAHPRGEALIDLNFAAVDGQAVVTVHNVQVESSSLLFDAGSQLFSQQIRVLLGNQFSAAINQAIADLPKQEPMIKRVEIIDIYP